MVYINNTIINCGLDSRVWTTVAQKCRPNITAAEVITVSVAKITLHCMTVAKKQSRVLNDGYITIVQDPRCGWEFFTLLGRHILTGVEVVLEDMPKLPRHGLGGKKLLLIIVYFRWPLSKPKIVIVKAATFTQLILVGALFVFNPEYQNVIVRICHHNHVLVHSSLFFSWLHEKKVDCDSVRVFEFLFLFLFNLVG